MDEKVTHSSMRRFLVAVIMWPKCLQRTDVLFCLPMGGGMVMEMINMWQTPIG
jgi:hypothetical protein